VEFTYDVEGTNVMTIIVDDAGIGDLLFGVVIGAYRSETQEFTYGVVDVSCFQYPSFNQKEYLKKTSRIAFQLLKRLRFKANEPILICNGFIFDRAFVDLIEKYSDAQVRRTKVSGEPQRLTETAYLDEIRNLGYEPLKEREKKRAKSFYHMLHWLERNPDKMKYAKTGWPKLSRYHLFKPTSQTRANKRHVAGDLPR